MDKPDYIAVTIGHAGRLNAKTIKRSVERVAAMIQVASPLTAISIAIGGYDDDPRELYEIPQVRRFVLRFIQGMQDHGIPLERFMGDTRMLVKLCAAAQLGKTIELIGDYDHTMAIQMLDEFVAESRKRFH